MFVANIFQYKNNRRKISKKISIIYRQCFNIEVIDQRNSWIPHNICSTCYQMLNRWNASQQSKEVKFITIWKKPIDKEIATFVRILLGAPIGRRKIVSPHLK